MHEKTTKSKQYVAGVATKNTLNKIMSELVLGKTWFILSLGLFLLFGGLV